jgi:hypothetical protein
MSPSMKHMIRTATLPLMVAFTAAGCGGAVTRAPDPDASREESATVSSSPAVSSASAAIECGKPFHLPSTGTFTLTGSFPTTASTGGPAVSGAVDITSRTAIRGVASANVEVFLVRDGRVVTLPMPQDAMGIRWEMAPGETRRVPGMASLMSCDPAGGPVRAGSYQLYARMALTADDGGRVESFGGPWPLEVR